MMAAMKGKDEVGKADFFLFHIRFMLTFQAQFLSLPITQSKNS
jgi:hypothetical protein